MRSIHFILVFVFFSFSAQAQYVDRTNFRAGLNGGIVTGDLSEAYSLVHLYQH